jgi:membrane protein implicated in regulation of membrane protease activity
MSRVSEFFKSTLVLLAAAALAAAGLVAFFVAWWIAAAAVLAFALYVAVRRMFARTPDGGGPRGGPAVIEGEYRIEREDARRPEDR